MLKNFVVKKVNPRRSPNFSNSGEVDTSEWRRINERVVNNDHVLTMFGVQSYRTEKLFNEVESSENINQIKQCLKNTTFCSETVLTENALRDICSMTDLDQVWIQQYNSLAQGFENN